VLAKAHTGIFTTLRADGTPISLPMWFVPDPAVGRRPQRSTGVSSNSKSAARKTTVN
jgi:hypothetical protein